MYRKLIRITIGMLEAFIGVSAVAGGILLLAGTYKDGVLIETGGGGVFPLAWLQNTPFSDYTVPAIILAIVGVCLLCAAVMILAGREVGVSASAVAGLLMGAFIGAEVLLLKQGVSWMEGLYGGLGLVVAGFAIFLWRSRQHDLHVSVRLM